MKISDLLNVVIIIKKGKAKWQKEKKIRYVLNIFFLVDSISHYLLHLSSLTDKGASCLTNTRFVVCTRRQTFLSRPIYDMQNS